MNPTLAARISWALALTFLVAPATSSLWAQGDEWDKHMRAGGKALEAGRRVKYYWPDPYATSPETVRDFAKAEREFQAALALTQTFPTGDPRRASTLGALASVYMEEGKFAEAEEQEKQVVADLEASLGPEDPILGVALAKLAVIYDYASKPDEAAPFWDRSLAILKKAGRIDSEFMAKLNFAAVLFPWGPVGAQIRNYIVELKESTGASDSDLRDALAGLARTEQGPYAEWDYTRILEIDKRIHGPDDPATISDMESLAKVFADEGKYAAALPLLLQSLEVRQKNRPVFEAERVKGNTKTAIVSLRKNKLAEEEFESELRPLSRNLAEVRAGAGEYPEAEELYKQVISSDEANVARGRVVDNMDLSSDLIDLARVYRHEHRYDEAVNTINRSETVDDEIANSKFGKEHIDLHNPSIWLWQSKIELAEIYREKGDTAAAEPLFLNSVEMLQALKLGRGHPDLAHLLDNYATQLRDEGKFDEAESFYKRALDTWAESRYPDHPDVAGALSNYAALLRKLDRAAEAEPMEKRAAAILAKTRVPSPVQ
jgi:tetratricopeptide (TPR) repeat protein